MVPLRVYVWGLGQLQDFIVTGFSVDDWSFTKLEDVSVGLDNACQLSWSKWNFHIYAKTLIWTHQHDQMISNEQWSNPCDIPSHWLFNTSRIFMMAYYNPHITGKYSPLYTANNQGFGHCSTYLHNAVLYKQLPKTSRVFFIPSGHPVFDSSK